MFTITTNKSAISSQSSSTFISKSGIYDATIKFASVDTSTKGAKSVNFNLDVNGTNQTIYGPYIYDRDGNSLEIGLKLINQLAILAGLRDGDHPTIETETHNVGRDNKAIDFEVITDFTDLPIKVRIQMEYSMYEGNISERKNIKAFFSADGASPAEIIARENGENVTIGKDLEKQQKYVDNVTYKDGLTAEAVASWLADKAANKAAPSNKPTPKVVNKPAGSLFR